MVADNQTTSSPSFFLRDSRASETRAGVSPFLAWGDFHARLRFARSTIPEEKWGITRSLADNCHSSKRNKFVNFRLNFNYFVLKIKRKQNVKLFCFSLNWKQIHFVNFQNITFLLRNENKNKSEIKAEVKLICSRPVTAIQNRKGKIIMFMAGNCHSKQEN